MHVHLERHLWNHQSLPVTWIKNNFFYLQVMLIILIKINELWLFCSTLNIGYWQTLQLKDHNILGACRSCGQFHFWIQCSIDLSELVFGIVNHDGLSIVNQLKKTTHELLFTKRRWVKSFSCGCANLANCIHKCCLDLGYLVFTQKES